MNNLDTPTVIGIFENRLPAFSFYFYKILWQSFHAKFEYTHSAEADLEQHKHRKYNLQKLMKKMFAPW